MSTSNPVAPAGYGKMLGGDANKDEKKKVEKDNLSNSDFRKLMMTPAVGGKSSFDSFKAPLAKTSGVSIKGVSASKQKYKEYYKQKEKEKKEHDAKYRDRAAERRKTEDADVVDDPTQEHSNYNMFGADGQSATSAELRNAEIERTRYLGGDVEHTHLVRGLDYALLQKVKSDITQEDEGKGEDGGDRAAETKGVDAEAVQVKSAMARNLMRTAFDTTSRYRKNESFRPGRMAYKFTLTSVYGGMENDIPTTLLRSAEEMKGKQKITQTTTNDLVIEKLASIFLAVRQGARSLSTKEGKQKKSKDKHGRERGSKHPPNEKATAHTAAVKSAEEDDEDIFADVGKDYTPSLPTPTVGRPSVGGPNPNPAQSIGAENGPKTEAGPVGPSMHPSRMKYFQGSASSLETQLPVNTGVDAQAHVNTQGAESEADPYAPTRPVVDEGDDSVTGAYGEESVTAVYGDMQVDADDATAPDGSDDVTAPYGSDAVTALYGQKDGVTAAYGQDESVTGVYGDDGNYGYAQAAPPSPAQAPEPQFNYSFTSQTAQSLAHVQAHTTQAQAQATHLPPMPVHHQHRRKPPTSSR
ncbi:hypothetical protein SARC_01421 [Sphaeroforma arctica JP610]|uniref:RED-like N-terminal domain-containing protein n=1 Tax=Sphaeroforma arctica JP610 TaxID=667725 RepID=A0A0L0GBN7_9EUKA|nr:hypothetical protein SARC_01421 [Sphaeroforma arctica JP610]KNC86415.1 hypothetical protein SARC_01421 [Sphaeroforma arctica JP610]|eukprot:XP_014160317.1 hypothetical protein SARC_01421 [Sphaeroforma arctica JP610]